MGTNWVCFACGVNNSIEEHYCTGCGAPRPLAVQGFTMSSPDDLELPSAARPSSEISSFSDDSRCMEEIEQAVEKALREGADAGSFKNVMHLIFSGIDEVYSQLEASCAQISDPEAVRRLAMRREDSQYIFRLALMQFDMYDSENKRPLRVGLMLSRQAYEGLHWIIKYLKNQQDPDLVNSRDLIGSAIAAYVSGQTDSDSYFDAVCQADDIISDLISEGADKYRACLEAAKSFDGTDYRALLPAKEAVAAASELWVKAIIGIHSDVSIQP